MLRTISTGKKPMGSPRRPSPTAMALAGYLLTITAATTLTIRRLAAEIDRDARSCRTAAEQLIAFGVEGLTWADADSLTFRPTMLGVADARPIIPDSSTCSTLISAAACPAESVPVQTWDVPPVERWEEEFHVEREPVDEQLSLFGGAAPVRPSSMPMTMTASAVRRPTAVDIDVETDAENSSVIGLDTVKTRTGCFVLDENAPDIDVGNIVCANLAQSLHKPCTEIVQDVQKAGHGALAAAMERLAATLDGKPGNISAHTPAPAPTCARATKEKQENINNQSTNVNQEALNHEFKLILAQPSKIPKFDAAERERRFVEIREKVPDAAEHVVGTLANMMAFGTMPESVFYGALTDASAPTVRNQGAFLNAKVQQLKKEYRWCS